MKQRTRFIIVGLILAVIVTAAGYAAWQANRQEQGKESQTTTQPTSSTVVPQEQSTPTPTPTAKPGVYEAYSEAAFAAAKDQRRVLFFHAQWCPQCRNIDKTIQAQGVPDGMVILKVDYDHAQQLRQKYGVTLQTTVVEVDAAGNLKKKYVAYNEPTRDAVLRALGE